MDCSAYVNQKKALKSFVWMRDEILSVWTKDPTMAVVDMRVLQLLTRGRVELEPLGGDGLPWGQSESPCFDGIRGRDQLGRC